MNELPNSQTFVSCAQFLLKRNGTSADKVGLFVFCEFTEHAELHWKKWQFFNPDETLYLIK